MLIIPVQKEETAGMAVAFFQNLIKRFQSIAKQQAGNFRPGILGGHPLVAEDHSQKNLRPLLCAVVPFCHIWAAVIDKEDAGRCKEHAGHTGTSDLYHVNPHFLNLTGAVKGRGFQDRDGNRFR